MFLKACSNMSGGHGECEGDVAEQVPRKGHLADQQVCASAAHGEKSCDGAPKLGPLQQKRRLFWGRTGRPCGGESNKTADMNNCN